MRWAADQEREAETGERGRQEVELGRQRRESRGEGRELWRLGKGRRA